MLMHKSRLLYLLLIKLAGEFRWLKQAKLRYPKMRPACDESVVDITCMLRALQLWLLTAPMWSQMWPVCILACACSTSDAGCSFRIAARWRCCLKQSVRAILMARNNSQTACRAESHTSTCTGMDNDIAKAKTRPILLLAYMHTRLAGDAGT